MRAPRVLLVVTAVLALCLGVVTAAHGAIRSASVATAVSVSVTTDAATYQSGQTATIRAAASGTRRTIGTLTSGRITIIDSAGTVLVNAAPMRMVSSTAYEYAFQIPSGAAEGLAAISVVLTNTKSARFSGTGSLLIAPVVMPGDPHAGLTYDQYPSNCRSCHAQQFSEVHASLHYQWKAPAPDNLNKPGTLQGKIDNALNSYCISILGDWTHCGKCHTGRGAKPVWTATPTPQQLDNIDCLVCHSDPYAQARVRKADGSMGPTSADPTVLNGYVRAITLPSRATCLKCHAFAGGGDGYKRGDIVSTQANTTDKNFDVHMATTGADLRCQQCHEFKGHKVTGKGSDLQSTDYASEVSCLKCHPEKSTATGHATTAVNSHIARVACQTCHIPRYAKDAADTAVVESTEVERDWRVNGTTSAPFHPHVTKATNLMPQYRWWNRTSTSYLLGDAATYDPATGAYPTSRPAGGVADSASKLYPFKYKTAYQPMNTLTRQLVALDTWEYIWVSGNATTSTTKGLFNMGLSVTDPVTWVKTDTFQLLNHEIPPATQALRCTDCHGSTTRMDLKRSLGYATKEPMGTLCDNCHGFEDYRGFQAFHYDHVNERRLECSNCHTFSRPERGGRVWVPEH